MSSNLRVLNASAGSGKTTRLVNEYLYLILQNKNPFAFKEVLAITFTNKAALEMKQRVIEELQTIAFKDFTKTDYLVELHEKTGINKLDFQKRANDILFTILHNYSDFAISTIDAFVLKILKTFSKDLGLPSGFEVNLEELKALENSINTLIEEANINKDLLNFITEFTLQRLNEEKSWNIEYSLNDFCKILLSAEQADAIKKLSNHKLEDFVTLRDELEPQVIAFEKALKNIGIKGYQIILENNVDIDAFPNGSRSGAGTYFKKLAEGEPKELKGHVTGFLSKDYKTGVSAEQKAGIDKVKDELRALIKEAQIIEDEGRENYNLFKLVLRSLYPMGLLKEVKMLLEKAKNEENYILISDFNKIVTDAIKDEPAPFIYHRTGERFKHIFIDEFQDTSVIQWQNLFPLVENSLGGGNQVLIVGDVKQSIYRWRGGEAEQLAKFPTPVKAAPHEVERFSVLKNFLGKAEPLVTNYRSDKRIIDFNNFLFSLVEQEIPKDKKDFFLDFHQETPKTAESGYVEVKLFNDNGLLKENQLNEVLKIVQSLKNEQKPLNHVAILCRKNAEVAEVASYLIQNNIPVISAEGLLVKNSKKVCLIATCLIYLQNIGKSKELNATLSIWLQKNEIATNIDIHDLKTNLLASVFPKNNLNELFDSSEATVAETLANWFNFLEEDAFISTFLNALYDAELDLHNHYANFEDWWTDQKDSLAIESPENINAVQVMSLHKSKGLQFETVILPYVWYDTTLRNYSEWIEIPKLKNAFEKFYLPISEEASKVLGFTANHQNEKNKTLIDSFNLLYVACTRPKKNLFIFGKIKEKKNGKIESLIGKAAQEFRGMQVIGENHWKYGTPYFSEAKLKEEKPKLMVENSFSNWKSRLKIAAKFQQYKSKAMEKGIAIHEVLEKINSPNFLAEDWFKNLSPSEQEKIKKLIAHPKLKEAFTAKNQLNEVEILMNDGSKFRPDKVALLANKTLLIDYKTGEKKKSYQNQLKNYKKALEDMGYTNIEALIAYIDLEEIEEVI